MLDQDAFRLAKFLIKTVPIVVKTNIINAIRIIRIWSNVQELDEHSYPNNIEGNIILANSNDSLFKNKFCQHAIIVIDCNCELCKDLRSSIKDLNNESYCRYCLEIYNIINAHQLNSFTLKNALNYRERPRLVFIRKLACEFWDFAKMVYPTWFMTYKTSLLNMQLFNDEETDKKFPHLRWIITEKGKFTKYPLFRMGFDELLYRIIIIIRGSTNIKDWMINFKCTQIKVGSSYFHKGMYESMLNISKLIDEPIKNIMNKFSQKHITIHISGHSLGGGLAAMLAIHLRSQYKNVYAWSFGAPCICDLNTATIGVSFIRSFVYGKDFVPKLNLNMVLRTLYLLERLSNLQDVEIKENFPKVLRNVEDKFPKKVIPEDFDVHSETEENENNITVSYLNSYGQKFLTNQNEEITTFQETQIKKSAFANIIFLPNSAHVISLLSNISFLGNNLKLPNIVSSTITGLQSFLYSNNNNNILNNEEVSNKENEVLNETQNKITEQIEDISQMTEGTSDEKMTASEEIEGTSDYIYKKIQKILYNNIFMPKNSTVLTPKDKIDESDLLSNEITELGSLSKLTTDSDQKAFNIEINEEAKHIYYTLLNINSKGQEQDLFPAGQIIQILPVEHINDKFFSEFESKYIQEQYGNFIYIDVSESREHNQVPSFSLTALSDHLIQSYEKAFKSD